ncbi:MAG: nitroreductase family deazaflavin-dependent oxidoreductase [Chloroflexi bacterium]|nr:nitroreductase family deazaflavin-dependent oxidoreductase [Chloroflexota bacterium]
MYGAGECFAYAATGDPKAKERAKQAFEALRFLQKVTQGGEHSPPKGYVARTILPADGPDPNIGSLERDQKSLRRDRLWKSMAAMYDGYDEYQKLTTRVIPVVVLKPAESG